MHCRNYPSRFLIIGYITKTSHIIFTCNGQLFITYSLKIDGLLIVKKITTCNATLLWK